MLTSFLRRHVRLMGVAVVAAGLGAGASAIATAGAATSRPDPPATHRALWDRGGHHPWLRRAVQGQAVVRTAQGWATLSFERGRVDSVQGRQLTLTEGTRTASYKTVTVTIPADATVLDNRRPAALSAVAPGQRVIVVQGPLRTWVIAHTPLAAG